MIIINIYVSTVAEAKRLTTLLKAEKFVHFSNILKLEEPFSVEGFEEAQCILQLPTRATLYNDIEAFLEANETYKNYFLYSVPVVNTSGYIMKELRANTSTGLPA